MTNIVALPQPDGDPEPIPDFSDFWTLYPRHIAKKDAARAWSKLTDGQRTEAIVGAANWRKVWQSKDPEYIPYPATWLNGWRWEDELPQGYSGNGSQAYCVAPSEPVKRGTMPDHVKALLAKLRGKP